MAISNFVSRGVNGDAPIIYDDGEQIRDFTYVDVVGADLARLDTDAGDGEVLNIGSTDTINDLASRVIEETGADVDPVHEATKEADARRTHADVSKARELIGYDPDTDIRTGVSRFVRWYRKNREWYEPLVLESSRTVFPPRRVPLTGHSQVRTFAARRRLSSIHKAYARPETLSAQ